MRRLPALLIALAPLSAPAAVRMQVPVVLDAPGIGGSHFTSDLVLANRADAPTGVALSFPSVPGVSAREIVGPGRQLRIADVMRYFRDRGSLPGGSQVGTLLVTFEDVSDPDLVFAGSRTATPNPNAAVGGSFGLFDAARVPELEQSLVQIVMGLREDASVRSNLGLVDVPGGTGPATVSVQVYDGDTGLPSGPPLPVALEAGGWTQLGSVLGGVRNGWAAASKTGGGTDAFFAYGVVNDGSASGGGTSDGSYVTPNAASGLVPVVVAVTAGGVRYLTELSLLNATPLAVDVPLTYTPSLGGGAPVTATVPLGPGRQLRVPDALAWLRETLRLPLPGADVDQAGTLLVSGARAVARVWNGNPDASVGGTFGVAAPAVQSFAWATTEAWIYGLRQDASSRSNLAIADARVGDLTSVSYVVDVFDGDSGTLARTLGPFPLAGGGWTQVNGVLEKAGVGSGYARVRPATGRSKYVAYGVVNDGAAPGRGTSDGSWVPMRLPSLSLDGYAHVLTAQLETLLAQAAPKAGAPVPLGANLVWAHPGLFRSVPRETLLAAVDALQAAGATQVDLNLGLDPFATGDAAGIATIDAVVARIRQDGLRLQVNPEVGASDRISGFADFRSRMLALADALARRYQPDVFVVLHEPATMAARTGMSASDDDWVAFVSDAAAVVRSASPQTKVGAGGLPGEPVLDAFATLPALDVFTLDIYAIGGLPAAAALFAKARGAGKEVQVEETWRPGFFVASPGEETDINTRASGAIASRDLALVDQKWMAALAAWGATQGLSRLTFFWTPTFFALSPGTVNALDPAYLALSTSAAAQGKRTSTFLAFQQIAARTPMPEKYTSLDASLKTFMDAQQAQLAAYPPGTAPITWATELTLASSAAGTLLLTPQHLPATLLFLDRIQELGIGGVKISIQYPMLVPRFMPSWASYLAYWRAVVQGCRDRGIKVLVQASVLFAGTTFTDLPVSYAGLSIDTFKSEDRTMVQLIIDQLAPDYLTLIAEPDTEATLTGLSALATPAGTLDFVQSVLSGLNRRSTLVGAGTGTWLPPATSTLLAQQTSLDYIDLHVYPVYGNTLANAIAVAQAARAAGKRLTMTEAWLYKTTNPSQGGVAASADLFKLDSFAFWHPRDAQFLGLQASFAKRFGVEFVSPTWSNDFFALLAWTPALDALSWNDVNKALNPTAWANIQAGAFTPTGLFWSAMAGGTAP